MGLFGDPQTQSKEAGKTMDVGLNTFYVFYGIIVLLVVVIVIFGISFIVKASNKSKR